MNLVREVYLLFLKEIKLEWRQRFAVGGLLMYSLSMVVVVSLSLIGSMNPEILNVLYWLIVLFSGINVVAKSFQADLSGQTLYLYTLVHPVSIILAKILYNTLLLLLISIVTAFLFIALTQTEVIRLSWLIGLACLGALALSSNLTLVSAIASGAENRSVLLSVLSFPLIIPIFLSLIKNTRYALDPAGLEFNYDGIVFLGGFSLILVLISTILFPFIWRN